jgi:hypothetical protein
MTEIGTTPVIWATSYNSRSKWNEPKLAALRSVRSRMTRELKEENTEGLIVVVQDRVELIYSSDLNIMISLNQNQINNIRVALSQKR